MIIVYQSRNTVLEKTYTITNNQNKKKNKSYERGGVVVVSVEVESG